MTSFSRNLVTCFDIGENYAWFASNPDRHYRLRRIAKGEFSGLGKNKTHALFKRHKPGYFEVILLTDDVGGSHLDKTPEGERASFLLWHQIVNAGLGKVISDEEMHRRFWKHLLSVLI